MKEIMFVRAKLGKVVTMALLSGMLAMVGRCEPNASANGAAISALGKEQEPVLREIAYTATLAKFVSTNCQAFAAALAPSARKRWLDEEPTLRVKNAQFFLPDFFKVTYVYNGSVSGDTFCFGLYNPFYDHMLLCKAKDLKQTEVVDYKWVSGSALRGDESTQKYPAATGVNPPDDYFPTMLKTLGDVLATFNRKCVSSSPDAAFSALPALDADGIAQMLDIAVFRTAQAVKMTGDKSSYGLATLGSLILRDEKFSSQPFVGTDETTRAVVKAISKTPADFRAAFRPVGYFEADDEKCVVFFNSGLPRFLALVRSKDGKNVKLGMFDANSADGWEKKITRK